MGLLDFLRGNKASTSLASEQLRYVWETDPDTLVKFFIKGLRDLGYGGNTESEVKGFVTNYYDGEESASVMEQLVHIWLQAGFEGP